MEINRVVIIGGGNLGVSIALGILRGNMVLPENITITRRRIHKIDYLTKKHGINVSDSNVEAVKNAQLVILTVKPNQTVDVLQEISAYLNPQSHIIVSAITGVSFQDMSDIVNSDIPLYRIMPNTAIAIQQSMTCLSFHNGTVEMNNLIFEFFEKLGRTVVIGEELMSAATVLAACGIAFAMRFMRASAQAGVEMGFGAELAQLITTQTLRGASDLLLDSGNHPEHEIDKVTTPMGVTISGLNEMEYQGFSSSLIKGLMTSFYKLIGEKR